MSKKWINRCVFTVCAISLGCLPLTSMSSTSQLPDILTSKEHFLPDFSYAGYKFGLEDIPQQAGHILDIGAFGAIANDGKDDSQSIIRAIEHANTLDGAVTLRFPAGRFMVTEIIDITRSNFTMRGAGRGTNGTIIHFPRPLKMVDDHGKMDELREYLVRDNKRERNIDKNLDVLFSEYSWTGGFIWIGKKGHRGFDYLDKYNTNKVTHITQGVQGGQGQLKLTLSDTKGLSTGQRIQILWYNKQGENGALVKSLYNDTEVSIGSRHWQYPNKALVKQRSVIRYIDGNTITLADPLLHDVNAQLPAFIAKWEPLEHIGLEDLRFEFPDAPNFGHHVEQGYNAIHYTGIADSWFKNLSIVNADSAILSYDSANVTLSDISTLGKRVAHYAVHMGNVHNVLAQNIQVFNPVIHSLSFNTQCTRSVYKDSEVFTLPTLDQHAGANHQNLFDNIVLHLDAVKTGDTVHYPVFWGSGAGYWQPGHGRFNTTWNLKLLFESVPATDDPIVIEGTAEGPDKRIVGLSANRAIALDYRPTPYVEHLNKRVERVPSLYDYQLAKRKSMN